MSIKARLKLASAKIQTKPLGLEGAPYLAAEGAVVTFKDEKQLKAAEALYGSGAFEVIEEPKPKAAGAAKKGEGK